MTNEKNPGNIESTDKQTDGQTNPLELVNESTKQASNAVQTNEHKGVLDNLVALIAKLMGKPDPLTGKQGNKTIVSKGKALEVNQNDTNTGGGLFEKFSGTLSDIGNKVEGIGEKSFDKAKGIITDPIGSAKNVVDTAVKIGEMVVDTGKSVVNDPIGTTKQTVKTIGGTVENLGGKVLGEASNLTNKGIEAVEKASKTILGSSEEDYDEEDR